MLQQPRLQLFLVDLLAVWAAVILQGRGAAVEIIFPIIRFPLCGTVAARHLPAAHRADQQAGKQIDAPGLVVAD